MGTEHEPELVDDEGDVHYSDAYSGPAHDYLDILSLWMEYDNRTDRLGVTLKTLAPEGFEAAPNGYTVTCSVFLSASKDGEPNGRFSFEARLSGQDGTQSTRFAYIQPQAVGSSLSESFVPIEHAYEWRSESFGYHVVQVALAALTAYADSLSGSFTECAEYREPLGGAQLENSDDAGTDFLVNLTAFGPGVTGQANESVTKQSNSPAPPTDASEAASLGVLGALAAAVAAFTVSNLRRRAGR